MSFTFPDVREVLFVLVPRAVDGLEPYYQLTIDFADHLPAALIYRVGGSQSGPFREDRMAIDVYAEGSSAANDVAQQVCAFLADSWHDVEGALLDSVEVEVTPTEIPYMSDTVNLVSATYRVATRAT